MKSKLVYIALLLGAMACRNEDRIRIPNVQEGVNMRIVVDPAKSDFASSDLNNTTFEFDAYSINQNLSKVEFLGSYIDASEEDTLAEKMVLTLAPSDFANGKARGVISAAQVASAFGLAGGVSGMGVDDELLLTPVVTLSDGRVFSAANSAPSITAGANSSFTVLFGTTVK